MNYQIIYADPPWSYRDKANAGQRGAIHKYNTLTIGELFKLPVRDIAAPHCLLAMWWVNPMPEEALEVIRQWGFILKTMAGFTWHKTTKHGKDHFGMGNWTRANSECCLFATRGSPKRIDASVRQIITAPVREHSCKPDEARDRLVQLMGDVPRVELFACQKHAGWDSFGDECESDLVLLNSPFDKKAV